MVDQRTQLRKFKAKPYVSIVMPPRCLGFVKRFCPVEGRLGVFLFILNYLHKADSDMANTRP